MAVREYGDCVRGIGYLFPRCTSVPSAKLVVSLGVMITESQTAKPLLRSDFHRNLADIRVGVMPYNLPTHLVPDIPKSDQKVFSHPIVHRKRGAGDGRVG